GFKFLTHLDTYRLKSAKDLLGLGLKDLLKDKENIVVIEWPEKIEKYLPKNTVKVYFETVGPKERKVFIK
ncbi:MAG: tRNA (adenosine(37)-N6)-threonylcarbamoyltransferase complex ATPase subunit type 1 TsaE, partial [Patescibacteria group bacterium]